MKRTAHLAPTVDKNEVTVASELKHRQKEQRSRNDKKRLQPLEAQTKTQKRRVVLLQALCLSTGVAPRVAESSSTRDQGVLKKMVCIKRLRCDTNEGGSSLPVRV